MLNHTLAPDQLLKCQSEDTKNESDNTSKQMNVDKLLKYLNIQ